MNLANKNSEQTYEIGLVMAGAVSAGAYTAGVIDFLLEALDAWYQVENDGLEGIQLSKQNPPHDVKIKVLTGTSAGAIVGAILLSELRNGHRPLRQNRQDNNKLHKAWVDQVDIRPLLGISDLEKNEAKVTSLLDSNVLDAIAQEAFNVSWTDKNLPPYFADPLEAIFCTTNLRGVPYSLQFNTENGVAYGMNHHADYMQFSINSDGLKNDHKDSIQLGKDNGLSGNWNILKETALASGAFPVGLSPRILERKAGQYNHRKWTIPQAPKDENREPFVCELEEEISPAWPSELPGNVDINEWDYKFVNVDGGVANNEPVELARMILTQGHGRIPRTAEENRRGVLMIDPFPNEAIVDLDYDPEAETGLLRVLKSLLSAMISELRFKKEELCLARDLNVYSRWAISPSRISRSQGIEVKEQYALATGGLGGFGGFLQRAYRAHDYQLGRRNCQKFLRDFFGLDPNNSLFDDWSSEKKDQYKFTRMDGKVLLPIIPLIGSVKEEEPLPNWPVEIRPDMVELRNLLEKRMDAVIKRLITTELEAGTTRFLSYVGWWLYRFNGKLLRLVRERLSFIPFIKTEGRGPIDFILKKIEDDLNQRKL